MLKPFDSAVTMTPNASALVEKMPIATSPLIFLLWLTYMIMNEATITNGVATSTGETPTAIASESEAKPTSERPCPMSE